MADVEEEHILVGLPVGFRFVPTDEELVIYYLEKKVMGSPIPAPLIKDIDASDLYSSPPHKLQSYRRKELFFYVHQDENFHDECASIRKVGNGKGFWKSIGEATSICSKEGHRLAYKFSLTYYSGMPPNAKRTHWAMEEYRMSITNNNAMVEWILARIKRGKRYMGD